MRLLILISSTSTFFNLYQLQALYPWLATKYNTDLTLAGWLNMACLLGMMITAPFANWITRGFSPHRIILAGIGCLGLLNIGVGLSESTEALFTVRLLQGLVLPCILTTTMEIVGRAKNDSVRLKWVSYYVVGTILGSTLSRFYPAFSVDLLGWHGGFITSAGLLFFACLFIFQRARNFSTDISSGVISETFHRQLIKRALTEKRLLIAYSIGFGLLYSQSSIFTALGLYLAQPPMSQTSKEIGMIYLACLPALFAVLISPRLHKMQREKTLSASLIILFWGSISLMGNHYILVFLGVAGFSISTYLMQTQTTRMISKVCQIPVTFSSGLYLSFYYGGGSLGASLSAFAFHHWGWMGVLTFVSAAQVLILIFIILMSTFVRKKETAMLTLDREKEIVEKREYEEKSLTIVSIDNLDAIEWENIFKSFEKAIKSSIHHGTLTSKLLTESLLNDRLRKALLAESPGLRKIQSTLIRAMRDKKHLIHIQRLGLRHKSADEQAIGFAALSLTMGLPLAAEKTTGQIVWDVMNRENLSLPYQTFSEGTGEVVYHTDTAFYKHPVRYFGLYCRKPANCGGGVNRFCNAAALRRKLSSDSSLSWIAKTLYETPAAFRVPSSFLQSGKDEIIEARVFSDDIAVRLRVDSIVKGHQIKYGHQNRNLVQAIDAFLLLADKPENRIKIKLDEDSAVYINNHEVLHYRDQFTDPTRHLMRIWIK